MSDNPALRQQLTAPPERVLARLVAMGKVMIVAQDGGVTHERIGTVEKVIRTDGRLMFAGSAHDCTVDVTQVTSVIADRSGRMKDKVLPKLEMLNGDGELLFSVVGLDGIEKFDEALARYAGTVVEPRQKAPATPPASLQHDDPAMAPLAAASETGAEIMIEMQKPGMLQRWSGYVPPMNPAMGFINIITPDFHLHVRGGCVARWEIRNVEAGGHIRLTALDASGKPVGLALQGPKKAFEAG
jgi:putative heme degradation protein